jgi:Transposase IS4
MVFSLLERFPGKGYHYFMDNLFISERFLEFLRKQGYGATGICRTNSRIITELIDLKKKQ